MNFQLRHSLVWQMIGPIPLMVIAAIAAVWFIVPRMIAKRNRSGGARWPQYSNSIQDSSRVLHRKRRRQGRRRRNV